MGVFTTAKQFALEIDMPGWWLPGSSVDLDFVHGRYFDSSLSAPASVGNLLSISRASIGYAKTSAGTLAQFSSGQLRITDLGLLIEDARTNLLPFSTIFGGWAVRQTTLTANQAVAPDGTTTMYSLVEDTSNAVHLMTIPAGFTLTANTTFVFSVFVADVDRRFVQLSIAGHSAAGVIYAYFDLQTGAVSDSGVAQAGTGTVFSSATIEPYANGVFRVSCAGIVNSSDSLVDLVVALSDRSTQGGSLTNFVPAYAGTSKTIYVWGPQVEQASFASSYIPTTTTSATRAADAVTCSGILSTLSGGTAGSAMMNVQKIANGGVPGGGAGMLAKNTSDFIILGLADDTTMTTLANSIPRNVQIGNSLSFTSGAKIASAWDAGGRSQVGGGGTVSTDGNTLSGGAGTYTVDSAVYNVYYSYIRRLTAWNTRLADATLQALTAP